MHKAVPNLFVTENVNVAITNLYFFTYYFVSLLHKSPYVSGSLFNNIFVVYIISQPSLILVMDITVERRQMVAFTLINYF